MNEKQLIERLSQLPETVAAPNKWEAIEAAIDQQAKGSREKNKTKLQDDDQSVTSFPDLEQTRKKFHRKWPMTMAASIALLLSVVFLWQGQPSNNLSGGSTLVAGHNNSISDNDFALYKTLASLQQANGQYYQLLGRSMSSQQAALYPTIKDSLKDIRSAKKHYLHNLELAPNDYQLQKKLVSIYQKERKLLKRLVS